MPLLLSPHNFLDGPAIRHGGAPRRELVVARFREDVRWCDACDVDNVRVYDKGGGRDTGHVSLPNIGREGHTYLHHIVRHYDGLAEVTAFVQGRIDDHLPRGADVARHVSELLCEAEKHGFSLPRHALVADARFRHPTYFGKPLHPAEQDLRSWFEQHVDATSFPAAGRPMLFYRNGIFAMSRQRILGRPKAYYERLRDQLLAEDPETGHFLERSWLYVFRVAGEAASLLGGTARVEGTPTPAAAARNASGHTYAPAAERPAPIEQSRRVRDSEDPTAQAEQPWTGSRRD